MKKACATQLAIYLIIAAMVGGLVYRRFPVGQAWLFAGIFGGFALYLGIMYLYGIRQKIADIGLIRRARSGDAPRDGERIAAIGRIMPNGPALTSPITKSPAIAYKYEVKTSAGKNDRMHYNGFALTPSTIQGQTRPIRLLAYPDLAVNAKYLNGGEAQQNIEEYVNKTEFSEVGIGNIGSAFKEMMSLFKDDDGSIRYDNCVNKELNFDRARLIEWVIKPGEQVCVFGHFSAEKGGIVPDPQSALLQVKIEVGEPDVFAGRAVRGIIGYLIGGVIFAGAALAGLLGLYAFVPLEATEQMSPSFRATWREVKLERLIESRVRVKMRQQGMLNLGETVTNMLNVGEARGRVNDAAVSRAEATEADGRTTVKIDGDMLVLTTDEKDRPVSLRILGKEVPLESLELQITDDYEGAYGGRLTYLTDRDDLPAARVTWKAPVVPAPAT